MNPLYVLSAIVSMAAGQLAIDTASPFVNRGVASGPLTPAQGSLVLTPKGIRDSALEGFSEDRNNDGFVDPVAQVAPFAPVAPSPLLLAGVPAQAYAEQALPAELYAQQALSAELYAQQALSGVPAFNYAPSFYQDQVAIEALPAQVAITPVDPLPVQVAAPAPVTIPAPVALPAPVAPLPVPAPVQVVTEVVHVPQIVEIPKPVVEVVHHHKKPYGYASKYNHYNRYNTYANKYNTHKPNYYNRGYNSYASKYGRNAYASKYGYAKNYGYGRSHGHSYYNRKH